MTINNLKEFNCFTDMLLSTVKQDETLEINLDYTGYIKKYDMKDVVTGHVSNVKGKVTAVYDMNGFIVSSTTTKKVIAWLSDTKPGMYKRCNGYLTFLDSVTKIEIESIYLNGEDILDCFVNKNTNCISLCGLCKYVYENTEYDGIKITLLNDCRKMTFQYYDPYFVRFVKLDDKYTLYINSREIIDDFMDDFTIANFAYCKGTPDITTQIDIYKQIAESNGCEFRYITK